jgi:hypothetical protein
VENQTEIEKLKKKKTRKRWLMGLGISAAALIGTGIAVLAGKNESNKSNDTEYDPEKDIGT